MKRTVLSWFKDELLASKAALIFLSLFIAILSWVFVNSGQIIKETRKLTIQYVQMPKGLVFQRTPIRDVKMELMGPLNLVRGLREQDLVYVVDLTSAKEGVNRIEIDTQALKLPMDVEVLNVNPRFFSLKMDELYVRTLPVRVELIGKPKDGFQVISTQVRPTEIQVSGPRSILSKVQEVPIVLPVINRDQSFFETIKPRLTLPDVEVLDSVTVEVEVSGIRLTRDFSQVPVVARGAKSKVLISPATASLSVRGSSGDLKELESKLEVIVPVENLKRGRYRIRGILNLRKSISVDRMDPSTFLVEVQ